MGIESDRLVYDYLSQVGDLAQQCGLPSRDRMRLVATLRSEIDQRRAGAGSGGQSEAGVKRILGKLGTPAEVVAKAGGDGNGHGNGYGGGLGGDMSGSGTSGGGTSRGGTRGGDFAPAPPAPARPGDGHEGSGATAREAGAASRAAGAADREESAGPGGAEPVSQVAEPPGGAAPGGPVPQEAPVRKLSRTTRERLAGFAERSGLGGLTTKGGLTSKGGLTGKGVPGPRTGAEPDPDRPRTASPPHLAGEDELSSRESDPDWWRTDPGPFTEQREAPFGAVDGFTGGIEIPELLRPPTAGGAGPQRGRDADGVEGDTREATGGHGGTGAGADGGAVGEGAGAGGSAGLLRRALRRRGKAAESAGAGRGSIGPVLLLSILLLVAGAVLGNVIVLAIGWVIAYYLGRLSPQEAKLAVLGVPGLVAGGAMVWLWGRLDGRWGEPIPEGGMADVLKETWPVVVRTAAVLSALFLLWRGRRRQRG